MYTYSEAKEVVRVRREAWEKFTEGKPDAFQAASGTDLTNSNNIVYAGMFAAEGTTGVYLYPPGLMAASSIPSEAFVAPELLEQPIWTVASKMIDYSDW